MFHLDELLKMKPKINSIQNANALSDGERIGDSPYVIKHIIYRSTDCFVYLAYHSVTDVHVVIKEFYPMMGFEYQDAVLHLKRNEFGEIVLPNDEIENLRIYQQLKRYYKEGANYMKGMASEKSIVTVIEAFECNNTVYIVSEYLPYPTLDILMKEKILLPRQAMALFVMILTAVESMHRKGYTVKSLKPTNIYITDTHVILGEFNPLKRSYFISRSEESFTNPYIAPELLEDNPIKESVDVYNVGRILEDLMEHVGYHMMEQNVQRSKGFEPKKINYLLLNTLKENPTERIQSIDEIIQLLTNKVIDKSQKKDVIKWFIAVLLILIAFITVRKSGIIELIDWHKTEKPAEEITDVVIQSSEFKFITKHYDFEFDGPKMIRWVDDFADKYVVTVFDNEEVVRVVIEANCVDLDSFGLNPGRYRLVVKNMSMKEIELQFTVVADNNVYIDSPTAGAAIYYFYETEKKTVKWSSDLNKIFRVLIYSYQENKLIYDLKTEQDSLDLSVLDLKHGDYLLCIQGLSDEKISLYEKVEVTIFDDDQLKDIILNMDDETTLNAGNNINWTPLLKGDVNIKIVSEETGVFVESVVPANIGVFALPDDLENGYYQLYITHTYESISSQINEKRVLIVD